MNAKSFQLTFDTVKESNNFFVNKSFMNVMSTQFKATWDNRKFYINGYGDSVISDGCLKNDGELLVSCGWGDGISFKRVFNGGFIKELNYYLYPQNNRAYYSSLTLDKARHIAYLGNMDYDNLRVYDYSGLVSEYLTSEPILSWSGSTEVPTNTTSANGEKWGFSGVPSETKNIEIRVLGRDFEGGMRLSVNGNDLGNMAISSYHLPDNSEAWFLFHTNSFDFLEETNEISIWSNSTDGGVVLKLEVYALENSMEVLDLGSYTEAQNNLPSDKVGIHYRNGLAIAGDYLYIVPNDMTWAGKMWRWNTLTQTKEELEVVNLNKTYTRYGRVIYSETTDRIYIQWKYDSELWVTTNASSATEAKTFCVRTEAAGFGDDNYCHGVIEDKENPNILYIWAEYYVGAIDITSCITEPVATGTYPTVIQKSDYTYNSPYFLMSEDMRLGENNHPVYKSDFINMYGRGAWGKTNGWFDKENNKIVMPPRYDSSNYVHYSNQPLYGDYNSSPVLVEVNENERYWVQAGYGGNMNGKLIVHEYEKGIILEESSSVTFGPFSFEGDEDIAFVQIEKIKEQLFIPSECGVDFFISNNNGETWEACAGEGAHIFNTTGNKLLFKMNFNGTEIKAPYIFGEAIPFLTIFEKQNNLTNAKRTSIKLGGAK